MERIEKALNFYNEKEFEKAIDIFSSILETIIKHQLKTVHFCALRTKF